MDAEAILSLIDEALDEVAREDVDGEDAILTIRSMRRILVVAAAAVERVGS